MIRLFTRPVYIFVIAGLSAFCSCDEPETIGINVIPPSDVPGVFFTDTITIEAYTIQEDSLRSDEAVAAFNLAGSYTDPVFGLSSASFYTQIRLPNNNSNFTFGPTPTLDSVVLMLAYADYYGDTLTPMNFQVYRVEENMFKDSVYFTTDHLNTNATALFDNTVSIHPKDSVDLSGILRAPHLRLLLDPAFGTQFITSGDNNFQDNNTLLYFFKGLYVKTTDVTATGEGSISSFNLQGALSKLAFYYRNASDTSQQVAYFEINGDCPRFNHFEHDYSSAVFGAFTDSIPGTNNLYVQSLSGLKVRIKFPYLKNFYRSGPVSINKAELVIPVQDNADYENHQNMIIFGVDSAGGEALIPDLLESESYFGGSYSITENTYKFSLNRYIQRVLSGKIAIDYGISLVSSGGAVNAFRTVIPGTQSTGTKMKLKITYSKLN